MNYLLVVSMINQLYLILIDGNDDDGSQRDGDTLPITTTATAITTTKVDEDALVSCF